MICPNCKNKRPTSVIKTTNYENNIIRRRECYICKERFNTYEISEQEYKLFINILNMIAEYLTI